MGRVTVAPPPDRRTVQTEQVLGHAALYVVRGQRTEPVLGVGESCADRGQHPQGDLGVRADQGPEVIVAEHAELAVVQRGGMVLRCAVREHRGLTDELARPQHADELLRPVG
jgi:hypothetical protein